MNLKLDTEIEPTSPANATKLALGHKDTTLQYLLFYRYAAFFTGFFKIAVNEEPISKMLLYDNIACPVT